MPRLQLLDCPFCQFCLPLLKQQESDTDGQLYSQLTAFQIQQPISRVYFTYLPDTELRLFLHYNNSHSHRLPFQCTVKNFLLDNQYQQQRGVTRVQMKQQTSKIAKKQRLLPREVVTRSHCQTTPPPLSLQLLPPVGAINSDQSDCVCTAIHNYH